ncbi:MAG: glycoside hydrolase family 16 protein [Treponema sp.]|nr:glycoside hydrolase family 16 protein [Treponema sp.]
MTAVLAAVTLAVFTTCEPITPSDAEYIVHFEYTITVTGGTATPAAAVAGTTVTVTAAAAPQGQKFRQWEVISGNITFANAAQMTTTFLMPADHVSVRAVFEDIPGIPVHNAGTISWYGDGYTFTRVGSTQAFDVTHVDGTHSRTNVTYVNGANVFGITITNYSSTSKTFTVELYSQALQATWLVPSSQITSATTNTVFLAGETKTVYIPISEAVRSICLKTDPAPSSYRVESIHFPEAQNPGVQGMYDYDALYPNRWNSAPTVRRTFFDDFDQGVRSADWFIINRAHVWGRGAGNYSEDNIMFSTNAAEVAAMGGTGGIVVMKSQGNRAGLGGDGVAGSGLVTREAYGAGLFEVRMKIAPVIGPCTAIWTYWNGADLIAGTNAHRRSEIDIELPCDYPNARNFNRMQCVTYDAAPEINGWTTTKTYTQPTLGTNVRTDGQWHTYAFEWRAEGADKKVHFYFDGQLLSTITTNIPVYTAWFWIANWFPPDLTWVGTADYDTAYAYIDWINIVEYNDTAIIREAPRYGGNNTPAINLGNDPIPQN